MSHGAESVFHDRLGLDRLARDPSSPEQMQGPFNGSSPTSRRG
jgi:hypothetical protein